MLILRYPRVDMFEPLQQFPDIYVDIADFAMTLSCLRWIK